jgi:hypothetical protein
MSLQKLETRFREHMAVELHPALEPSEATLEALDWISVLLGFLPELFKCGGKKSVRTILSDRSPDGIALQEIAVVSNGLDVIRQVQSVFPTVVIDHDEVMAGLRSIRKMIRSGFDASEIASIESAVDVTSRRTGWGNVTW